MKAKEAALAIDLAVEEAAEIAKEAPAGEEMAVKIAEKDGLTGTRFLRVIQQKKSGAKKEGSAPKAKQVIGYTIKYDFVKASLAMMNK